MWKGHIFAHVNIATFLALMWMMIGGGLFAQPLHPSEKQASITTIPLHLGSGTVVGGKTIVVPFLLDSTIHDEFPSATFNILFDTSCVRLQVADTRNTIFEGSFLFWQQLGNGAQCTLTPAKRIDSSGAIAFLTFAASDPLDDRSCALTIADWNFSNSSWQTSLTAGAIHIQARKPNLLASLSAPDTIWYDQRTNTYSPQSFNVAITVLNAGNREGVNGQATLQFDSSTFLLNASQRTTQAVFPRKINPNIMGSARWDFNILTQRWDIYADLLIDISFDNHSPLRLEKRIYIVEKVYPKVSLKMQSILAQWNEVSVFFLPYCGNEYTDGISKSDITLKENGKEITNYELYCTPFWEECCTGFGFVIDRQYVTDTAKTIFQQSIQRCLTVINSLQTGNCDEVFITSSSDSTRIERDNSSEKDSLRKTLMNLTAVDSSAVWDALVLAILKAQDFTTTCRSVLLFTDGYGSFDRTSVDDCIELALANKIKIYPIASGGTTNNALLDYLASTTGGRYLLAPSQKQLSTLVSEIRRIFSGIPYTCDIKYPLSCPDGSSRTIEMFLKAPAGCSGSDSASRVKVFPLDTTKTQNIYVSLGESTVKAGSVASIPLRLDVITGDVLRSAKIDVLFDTSRLVFKGLDRKNLLLDSAQVVVSAITGGIRITLAKNHAITSAGILALLHFDVTSSSDDTTSAVTLSQWKFDEDCNYAVRTNGKIIIQGTTQVTHSSPKNFHLEQNFPNPFSTSTVIKTHIADFPTLVSFKVLDLFGREVLDLSKALLDHPEIVIQREQLPSAGMYFYRLTSGKDVMTRAMMVR